MPETAEPPVKTTGPKQGDYAKVTRDSMAGWMQSLNESASQMAPAPVEEPPATPPAQPAKPPEKPAETPPPPPAEKPPAEKPTEVPDDKWPRNAESWKKFIAVRDENYRKRDDRIKELEGQLSQAQASLKNAPVDSDTYESLKAERQRLESEAKDYSEKLRLAAIEQHPKFKAYFDGKLTAQIELAKRVVGPDKADAIAQALKLPEGTFRSQQIEDLTTDLSPLQSSRLGSVLNAIESIHAERDSEIARARADYDAVAAKATTEGAAAREKAKTEALASFDAIVKQAMDPKEGLAIFQERAGEETWNKSIKARIEGAKATLFGGAPPDTLIKKALLAEGFPVLLESYNGLLKEVETLKSQVATLSKATPTIEGRTPTGEQSTTPRPTTKVGSRPMDVAADFLRGLQEASR